jgi:copper chaperone CopZ
VEIVVYSTFETTELALSGVCGARDWEAATNALECVVGVSDVQVSVYRASAVVTHSSRCSADDLVRAIEDAGFEGAVRSMSRACNERLAVVRR